MTSRRIIGIICFLLVFAFVTTALADTSLANCLKGGSSIDKRSVSTGDSPPIIVCYKQAWGRIAGYTGGHKFQLSVYVTTSKKGLVTETASRGKTELSANSKWVNVGSSPHSTANLAYAKYRDLGL